MKKIVIIGAGIAGLTCGIYAQRSGLEAHILEMHRLPGGECTGWDRGEFHFDGCIHWLTGSSPDTELYGLWRTTGALDDSVEIVNHEVFLRYEEDGRAVNLYTNADKLEKHLLEVSPQDAGEIKKLCKAVRALGDFGMPIKKPMDMMTAADGIKFAAKHAGKLAMLSRYNKLGMSDYAALFKDPLIRGALLSAIPGEYQANALVMTLACMHEGDGGYPVGGSRVFAKRMEQTFLSLGGKVSYGARADKVIVREGRAVGVALADGTEVMGDTIVSCADGYHTLYNLLENKHTPKMYKDLFEAPHAHYLPTSAIVFMGVDCDIAEPLRAINIKRKQPVTLGGTETDTVSILSYSFDKTMAPAGKTVMACYYGADYDQWHALHADKEAYKREKQRLIDDAVAALIQRYPEAEGKIERTDVVTPETYVRYCNAWRGAWMSWGSGKGVPQYFPGMLPGLEGFIMAGMWTLPPGGLPGAAAAGRFAAHRICLKEGIEFKVD